MTSAPEDSGMQPENGRFHPTIPLQQSQPNAESLIKGARPDRRVYKLVLTGGPCGGKTTGQSKLATFFESLGWKVFRVPETATVLMSGGIAFGDLNQEQVMDFQFNLLKAMLALEDTYFSMAEKTLGQNVLVICDRGTMDASAFVEQEDWQLLLTKLNLCESNICEGRYDHIVHMVSAAKGAEDFYSVEDHAARFEGLELARERDRRAMEAWSEHPYVDIVDNRVDFDSKLKHLIDMVVKRIGLDIGDRFKANSRKVKFCVKGPLPPDSAFPKFTDFEVVHHYLLASGKGIQSRLRKRGRQGRWVYTCTVRRPERHGQIVEVKSTLSKKEYDNLLNHADPKRLPVYKTRRCFLYNNQQYQLDIYRDPCHKRCMGLKLLETFTTHAISDIADRLPKFLKVSTEVTGDPAFSMYNLALRSEWVDSAFDFCHRLESDEEDETEGVDGRPGANKLEQGNGTLGPDCASDGPKDRTNGGEGAASVKAVLLDNLDIERAKYLARLSRMGTGGSRSLDEECYGSYLDDGDLQLKPHQIDILKAHKRLLAMHRNSTDQGEARRDP